MRQATLVLEPVVTLLAQLADRVAGEEGWIDTTFGGFPVDRLGAVLAELDVTVLGRIAPGAAGAVEAAVLVGLEQRAQVLERLFAVQPEAGDGIQRAPASGRALVGLVTGIDGLQAQGRSSSSGAGL
jgi:hypothetical protein